MRSFCRHILRIFIGVLVVNVVSVAATTPRDYKQRIDGIRSHVNELIENLDGGDDSFEREVIAEILAAVPQSEKIEWQGGSIETDNQWLKTSLDEFAKETDFDKQIVMLVSIDERLTAISTAVGDLEKAVEAERTKDADKQKISEILAREEYQKPEAKEESLFQKWWRQFLEWLESLLPKPSIRPNEGPNLGLVTLVLQILVFGAVIALVGFLLWRFAPYFSNRFRTRTKREKGTRVILGETIREDHSAADLFDEAESLARQGDLRGAIRKGYIALLCELGDRKIVRLARHKTNRDYLRDVRNRERIYEGMSGLTNNFERNWYGLRDAEPADWEDFCVRYRATIAEAKAKA